MTAKQKPSRPKLGGVPVTPIMEIGKGEAIAGGWVSDRVPGGSFYKLLAKRKSDGTCEWVHFIQRADGSKDRFIRGTVENESRLADVIAAISNALRTTYGVGVTLHAADADVYPVDGALVGKPPDRVQ